MKRTIRKVLCLPVVTFTVSHADTGSGGIGDNSAE